MNNNDLISRKAAIEAMEKSEWGYLWECEQVINVVKDLPPAELEQKKGKWIDEKINSYTSRTYCSECGSSAPFVYESDDYYGNHAHGETAKTKFCPNCGAKMERMMDL